jgi:hypothetical protein
MIHVDLDDARVGAADGEVLFKPHGGNAPYLEQVAEALGTIHDGLTAAPAMFALFNELNLIQPVQLNVDLGDGLTYNLPNFYTIGADEFASLSAHDLQRLNRSGFLAAAVFVRPSIANVRRLIEIKQRKRAAA